MTPRTLTVLLFISAALNIFVLGAAAGGLAMHQRAGPAQPAPRAAPLRLAGEALSPPGRAAFRQAMAETARTNAPIAARGRIQRRRAAELLAAPNLDAAAVNAALDEARASDFQLRTRLERTAVAVAAELTVEDRARLGQGLAQRRGPRGDRNLRQRRVID
jgi:uncharacterized membrane protein